MFLGFSKLEITLVIGCIINKNHCNNITHDGFFPLMDIVIHKIVSLTGKPRIHLFSSFSQEISMARIPEIFFTAVR